MCGILGSSNLTPQVQVMLPFVALAMESRGQCAWGASNGFDITRHLGPLHKTYGLDHTQFQQWDQIILHTRAASVGAAGVLENAHPFEATSAAGTRIIGIHNGGISNWEELNQRYSRHCNVDSEHLWMHRAAGLSWGELRGYANLAWFETPPRVEGSTQDPPTLYIARCNGNSLELAQTPDGGLIFASTRGALTEAAGMVGAGELTFFNLVEGHVYRMGGTTCYETEERVSFGRWGGTADEARGTWSPGPSLNNRSYDTHLRRDWAKLDCAKCFTPLTELTHLLCHKCLRESIEKLRVRNTQGIVPLIVTAATCLAELDEDGLAAAYGVH